MKRFFTTALIMVALVPMAQADWCGEPETELFAELGSTNWIGIEGQASGRTVYVVGAPWCPYTQAYFESAKAGRTDLDFRFVLTDPTDEYSRQQISSAILVGTDNALGQVLVSDTLPLDNIDSGITQLINEVQLVTNTALFDRYGHTVNRWGSPMTFVFDGANVRAIAGAPDMDELEARLPRMSLPDHSPVLSRFLSGIPPLQSISGKPYAARDDVQMHVLPDETALSTHCIPFGSGYPASGLIDVDGEAWIVFDVYRDVDWRLYGLASDFEGWAR